ncbi:hypothetical protein [Phaeovulum vinaykumarii]|uniref:Ribbon-helix-helix protein, copG family n=1 Tax=Phaeovulum vinaykumarii TaxID=407234 RepID=A0A1N7K6K6_9RHOB|nr:hypothetical protein [Phaeovulum vinaykumarii]SIS57231.1 hypothetical protein SAMN05421795_101658 [Phaeovulum vinaykumarii]SOB93326.1 hypothetical protein SAMN05878426_101655 [Phaeovulum vinaykumarii]
MVFMIKLSDERGEQLRQIAQAKKLAVADLIAEFIRSEVAAGTIAPTVPGVDVQKAETAIVITANGFKASVPMNEGPTLADVLKGTATLSNDPERKKQWLEGAAALSGVKVKLTGRHSLKLTSPLTGREYSLPLSVAADLGDQIQKVVE